MSAFEFIERITLSSAATSITFTNIPQTYKHLFFFGSGVMNAQTRLEFGNDIDGYWISFMARSAAETTTQNGGFIARIPESYENNFPFDFEVQVLDYSTTDRKTQHVHSGALETFASTRAGVAHVASTSIATSALTSYIIQSDSSNGLDAGTTISMFGAF